VEQTILIDSVSHMQGHRVNHTQ